MNTKLRQKIGEALVCKIAKSKKFPFTGKKEIVFAKIRRALTFFWLSNWVRDQGHKSVSTFPKQSLSLPAATAPDCHCLPKLCQIAAKGLAINFISSLPLPSLQGLKQNLKVLSLPISQKIQCG